MELSRQVSLAFTSVFARIAARRLPRSRRSFSALTADLQGKRASAFHRRFCIGFGLVCCKRVRRGKRGLRVGLFWGVPGLRLRRFYWEPLFGTAVGLDTKMGPRRMVEHFRSICLAGKIPLL